MSIVLAALLIVAALLLAGPVGPSPTLVDLRPLTDGEPEHGGRRGGRSGGAALAATVTVTLLLAAVLAGWLEVREVVQACAAAGVVAGVLALVARARRRRSALLVADQVLEACLVLADELRAGRSPERALELAARDCPELAPAVRAARLGADVPAAMRRGRHPDLRLLAGAWHVSHRSGDGLATALARVADGLRGARATRRVVASELASARSTAQLLVALPALALVGGAGSGGKPWEFLLATTAGTGCLVAGLALGVGGLWWIEAIAADVEQEL